MTVILLELVFVIILLYFIFFGSCTCLNKHFVKFMVDSVVVCFFGKWPLLFILSTGERTLHFSLMY